MNKFKICMLGAFAVGKTSLVQQFISGIFSEKYITTLGVKIDKKSIEIEQQPAELILWDLAGEDEFIKVRTSYLRGSSAVMLVVDGTRAETLDIVIKLKEKVDNEIGHIPFVVLVNKSDLRSSWNIDTDRLSDLKNSGWFIFETSARDSNNVDEAFQYLARRLLSG